MQSRVPTTISWRADAVSDVIRIAEFIQEQNPRAAERLVATIEEKVERLGLYPKMHRQGRVEGTREMLVRPTYVVVYTENDSEILILRVLHTSQQWP